MSSLVGLTENITSDHFDNVDRGTYLRTARSLHEGTVRVL